MWDEALEAAIRDEFAGSNDAELERITQDGRSVVARGRATYELARRAVFDPRLLALAIAAIDGDHVQRPRAFVPSGWPAAARILGSGVVPAITLLLRCVATWLPSDQEGWFTWCVPRGRRAAMLHTLRELCDYDAPFEPMHD
jgi:hypothetical protein